MSTAPLAYLMLHLTAQNVDAASSPSLAVYCAVSKWLPRDWRGRHAKVFVHRDTISYGGTPHTIVVLTNDKLSGLVFDSETFRRDRRHIVAKLINNAHFRMMKRNIDYPDPPLGGVWTQDVLSRSLRLALHSSPYSSDFRQFLRRPIAGRCEVD